MHERRQRFSTGLGRFKMRNTLLPGMDLYMVSYTGSLLCREKLRPTDHVDPIGQPFCSRSLFPPFHWRAGPPCHPLWRTVTRFRSLRRESMTGGGRRSAPCTRVGWASGVWTQSVGFTLNRMRAWQSA
jgi:hypothetical protein